MFAFLLFCVQGKEDGGCGLRAGASANTFVQGLETIVNFSTSSADFLSAFANLRLQS
mgnify:FL=1